MLIRSVLKEVGHRRDEVLVGPAVGQDCAVVELGEGEVFVLSSDPHNRYYQRYRQAQRPCNCQ